MAEEFPCTFLPYQAAVLNDKSRVRLIEKSRRVGASWAIAAEMTLDAAEVDGCDGWYIGYNKQMAEEFIRDCADWARKFAMAASAVEETEIFDEDEDKSILTYVIRFASGWRITALSSKPANLRNKKGHICIDEAAHHPDLAGVLKAAMAVLMWGGKGRVDIISTHHGEDNHFNTLIKQTRAGKRPYALHRITIDDALTDGLYKRICLVNNEEWTQEKQDEWLDNLLVEYGDGADEELRCIPSRSGGTYIGRNLIERAMRIEGDVIRLELSDDFKHWSESARIGEIENWCAEHLQPVIETLPTDKYHFVGEDFGRTSDRTVIAVGHMGQKLQRRIPLTVELLNVPFEQQRQIVFYLIDRVPRFFHGVFDSNGNGSYLAEVAVQRYGEDLITEAKITEQWYYENLPPFLAAFEDDLIELVRDTDHMMDLSAFKVVHGQPKLPKLKTASTGDGPPRHGDAGIAYLCAHIASRQEVLQYEGYETPKQPKVTSNTSVGGRLRIRKGGLL